MYSLKKAKYFNANMTVTSPNQSPRLKNHFDYKSEIRPVRRRAS